MSKISIHTSARELEQLQPLWEFIRTRNRLTIFQNFDWNLLAARFFIGREQPLVICAESSYGAAIVPAALHLPGPSLRLLGEELFDYRAFLYCGEREVLHSALSALWQLGIPMEITALRSCDCSSIPEQLELVPFAAAPSIGSHEMTADQFASRHTRLWRNLRRFQRRGFEVRRHDGSNGELLRFIYGRKAAQDSASLFHDQDRVQFIVEAGKLRSSGCEVFTLESSAGIAAAVVTLRDCEYRRFYTCWFDPELAALSPAMCLICEVTRQSLAAGLSCDYMTGEQPYKLRLATGSMPLYRLRATPEQLASLSKDREAPLRVAV